MAAARCRRRCGRAPIRSATSACMRSTPWKPSSGPIARLEVEFRGSGRDPNLRFDEWRAQADCESGGGRALLSWNARPMENRIVVRGTHGLVEADRFLQICRVHRVLPGPKFIGILVEAWRNAVLDVFRVPWSVLRFATGLLKPSPGIQASAAAFASAVHSGNQPPVPPRGGAPRGGACSNPPARRPMRSAARNSRRASRRWRRSTRW